MELLGLAQIPCIKCQNTTNQLAHQERHSLAICDRCLEAETRKYLRIGMEIQAYEKKIKEMKEDWTGREREYREGTHRLSGEEGEGGREDRYEMGREVGQVEQALGKEEGERVKLLAELRELQEMEELGMREYHKEWIGLERMQCLIGQEQQLLANLKQMQEHISSYQQDLQQIIK